MYIGKLVFLSGNGLHTHAHFSALCCTLSGRLQSKEVYLPRSIPLHGFRANYISRKFTRYRNLPACPGTQTLPYGHSWQSFSINHCRCQRTEKLENLCRLGIFTNQHSPKTLQRRIFRLRVGPNGLCTRCHNHRSLSVHVSMGQLQKEQGSRQAAYLTGLALQHSDVYSHLRRQTSRSQYTRHRSFRTRRVLCHGSWLSGLLQIEQPFTGLSLPSDSRKVQSPVPENLLASSGSLNRFDLRSDDHALRILSEERLSRKTATHKISRRRNRILPLF